MTTHSILGISETLHDRLAPAEELFFTWLSRVVVAGLLIGSAWIDDAPPLELAAWLITLYVVARVISEFGNFMKAAPFENRFMRVVCATGAIAVLGLSFLTVVTLVDRLSRLVA